MTSLRKECNSHMIGLGHWLAVISLFVTLMWLPWHHVKKKTNGYKNMVKYYYFFTES